MRPADKSSYTQLGVSTTTPQKDEISGGSSIENDQTTAPKAGGSQKAGGSTIEKQGVLTQKEAKSIIERGLKNEGGYQNEGGSKFIAKIIEVMNFEYMSVPEIMEKIGRKDRDRFNQNYINPALKLGIIERNYPDQPFHPHQRFRLTEKAMHIKYSQEEK